VLRLKTGDKRERRASRPAGRVRKLTLRPIGLPRLLATAALLVLTLILGTGSAAGVRLSLSPLVLACWLLAALLLWLTPEAVLSERQLGVFGVLFDAAAAGAMCAYPEVPSPLAGAAVSIALAGALQTDGRRSVRILTLLGVPLVGLVLRAIARQPLDGYLFTILAGVALTLGARWRPGTVRVAPAPAPAPKPEKREEAPPQRDTGELVHTLRYKAEGLERQLGHVRGSIALRRVGDGDGDLPALARRASHILCEELGFASASVWHLEPTRGELRFLGGRGTVLSPEPIARDAHLLSKVAHTGAPSLTARPTDGARDPAVRGKHADLGGQIVLPLVAHGATQGVLCLHLPKGQRPASHTPLKEQLDWASSVASALRERIEDDVVARQHERMEVLYEIARTFEAGRHVGDLLADVLRLLERVLDFENATVLILDPVSGKLKPCASHGGHVDLREELEFERGRGISAWVAENGRSLVIPDVREDQRWGTLPGEIRSFASYPLLSEEGETLGVLNLAADEPDAYGPEEKRVLQIVASQIALTMRRSDLYTRLEMLAVRDPATGVHNERFLPLAIDREIAAAQERDGGKFTLVLLHAGPRGERIPQSGLHHVAHAASEVVGASSGTVCRFETERLALILPAMGSAEASEVIDEIRARCGDVPVTGASATYPIDGQSVLQILSTASLRLGAALAPLG
jgi:GAF domain-containing protein